MPAKPVQPKRPPLPPPGFHPPLMLGALIPNTPSPTFCSIGLTRRCVARHLHNLKVLPSLPVFPDNRASALPRREASSTQTPPRLSSHAAEFLGFGAICFGKKNFISPGSEVKSGFWHHSWSHEITKWSSTSSPSLHITCSQRWCSSNQSPKTWLWHDRRKRYIFFLEFIEAKAAGGRGHGGNGNQARKMEPKRNREEDETQKQPWEPLGGLRADVGTCLTSVAAGMLKAQLEKPRSPSGANQNSAGLSNDSKTLPIKKTSWSWSIHPHRVKRLLWRSVAHRWEMAAPLSWSVHQKHKN